MGGATRWRNQSEEALPVNRHDDRECGSGGVSGIGGGGEKGSVSSEQKKGCKEQPMATGGLKREATI